MLSQIIFLFIHICMWCDITQYFYCFTLPEHRSAPLVLSGVRVTRSLVLSVCFVDQCLFCPFSFGHCVVCPSIYDSDYPLVSSNSSYI